MHDDNQPHQVQHTLQNTVARFFNTRDNGTVYVLYVDQTGIDDDAPVIETTIQFSYIELTVVNGRVHTDGMCHDVVFVLSDNHLNDLSMQDFLLVLTLIRQPDPEYPAPINVNTYPCTAAHPFFGSFFTGISNGRDYAYDTEFIYSANGMILYSGWNFNDNLIDHPYKLRADLQV